MFKPVSVVLALLLAAGCSGSNPFEDDTPDGGQSPTPPTIEDDPDTPEDESTSGFVNTGGIGALPGQLAFNLLDVTLAADGNSITVTGAPLDTTPIPGVFARDSRLDTSGYTAYSVQEDPLDRFFIALIRQSADGSVEGGVVLDGGQFNRFLGGTYYRRLDDYSPHVPDQPTNGLVSYTAEYVGLSNIDAPRPGEIMPVDPGTQPGVIPAQSALVTGTVFINADFADNTVNGAIVDRIMPQLVDPDSGLPGFALEDVVLILTDIEDDGTFGGVSEGPVPNSTIGTYGGVFGGIGATAVAGSIRIENYEGLFVNEVEYGTFVASQCDDTGSGALCDQANP